MVDDLLAIATDLTDRDQGRPKQASLRRACSTAYYAVFHAIAALCADELVGFSQPWDVYSPVYRSPDHRTIKRVLDQARITGQLGAAASSIALAFANLQSVRLQADYDPGPFNDSRQDVKDLISDAHETVRAIRQLPAETKLKLAVLLVVKTR